MLYIKYNIPIKQSDLNITLDPIIDSLTGKRFILTTQYTVERLSFNTASYF